MRHAVFLAPVGRFANPERLLDVARAAEAHGWDGLFMWDHTLRRETAEVLDPWVLLGALAAGRWLVSAAWVDASDFHAHTALHEALGPATMRVVNALTHSLDLDDAVLGPTTFFDHARAARPVAAPYP